MERHEGRFRRSLERKSTRIGTAAHQNAPISTMHSPAPASIQVPKCLKVRGWRIASSRFETDVVSVLTLGVRGTKCTLTPLCLASVSNHHATQPNPKPVSSAWREESWLLESLVPWKQPSSMGPFCGFCQTHLHPQLWACRCSLGTTDMFWKYSIALLWPHALTANPRPSSSLPRLPWGGCTGLGKVCWFDLALPVPLSDMKCTTKWPISQSVSGHWPSLNQGQYLNTCCHPTHYDSLLCTLRVCVCVCVCIYLFI